MFQIDRNVLFGNSVVGKRKPESERLSDSGFYVLCIQGVTASHALNANKSYSNSTLRFTKLARASPLSWLLASRARSTN